MTTDDLRKAKELCERATPGPWSVREPVARAGYKVDCVRYFDETPGVCGDHSKHWPLTSYDAEYIAYFDPTRIAAMVEEIELSRELIDGYALDLTDEGVTDREDQILHRLAQLRNGTASKEEQP